MLAHRFPRFPTTFKLFTSNTFSTRVDFQRRPKIKVSTDVPTSPEAVNLAYYKVVAPTRIPPKKEKPEKEIIVKKLGIKCSPLRLSFLVRLARDNWMMDALAQMKFSPKHRALELKQMLMRSVTLARTRHQAIPEELWIKEIIVNKGPQQKKMRIMGRGRTGFGYKRTTHLTVKVQVLDFEHLVKEGEKKHKKHWREFTQIAMKVRAIKAEGSESDNKKKDTYGFKAPRQQLEA